MMNEEFKTYIKNILANDEIVKIIISNNKKKDNMYRKIVIENKINKFFVSKYTNKQVFNDNITDIIPFLSEQIEYFKQFNFIGQENEYSLKFSKSGKLFYNKMKNNRQLSINEENNRKKNYILKEGKIIEPLIDLGIFTKEGKIINSMYDKYKQINRFIELIDDLIKDKKLDKINIIDFGCGKSYLTFIVYYYFKYIKNIDINITGLDLKKDVINNCNNIAKKYGYENLIFKVGSIENYQTEEQVDMVITLHACDMATDFAIFNAIKWKARYILSVPCCQHEINKNFHSKTFNILNRYGIAKERISAIYTDLIRCNLLETMNYKTQLLEFVDYEQTPKNLLIRATLSNIPVNIKIEKMKEVQKLLNDISSSQTLYDLITDEMGCNYLNEDNKTV